MMCADMVEVRWEDEENQPQKALALLEDISPSGACVQLENAIPLGTEVHWDCPKQSFAGYVRYCDYREIGFFVGVEFSDACGGRRRPLSHCICWIWKGWCKDEKIAVRRMHLPVFSQRRVLLDWSLPKENSVIRFCAALFAVPVLFAASANQPPGLLSDVVDVSADFHDFTSTYFLADRLAAFDPATGAGSLTWSRNQLYPRIASTIWSPCSSRSKASLPRPRICVNPSLPFSIQFVSPRTVRIRIKTGVVAGPEAPSPMLVGEPPHDNSWKMEKVAGGYRYASVAGSVTILENLGTSSFATPRAACSPRPSTLPTSPLRSIPRCHSPSSAAPPITRAAWPPSFRSRPMRNCSAAANPSRASNKRGQKVVLWATTPTASKADACTSRSRSS